MPSFRFPIAIFFAIFLVSCASTTSPSKTMDGEIQSALAQFQNAVAQKNARQVYQLLSKIWQSQFSIEEFELFFDENADIFLEYANALKADAALSEFAEPFAFYAQYQGDPCGSLQLQTDEQGQWKINHIPQNAPSETEAKSRLIQLIQSRQFMAALNRYAEYHPEVDPNLLRHLQRVLMFEPIPENNVEFMASQAMVVIPNTAHLFLECNSSGWSLTRCHLLH